jgi:hypothetical protein
MKPPIFVRELSKKERERLEAGLRSKDTLVMRRCQILLASARANSPPKIAENLGCASQTVRNAIRTFDERASTRSRPAPLAPSACMPHSTRKAPRLQGRCSTALRGSSDASRVCGPLDVPQSMIPLITERLQMGMPLCVHFPAPAIAVPGNGHDDRIEPRVRRVRR